MDLNGFKTAIEGLKTEENSVLVKQKSRDFFWYSPVLKRQLENVTADIVVTAKSEDEVVRIVAAAFAHNVPLTPRGAGTGNYGQAMPLSGGAVLNLAEMTAVKSIARGTVVAEAGAILEQVDNATRQAIGQEMRMHPSTYRTASIGGFVGGGSGGVGSVRWGGLRNLGNVLRLRLVTCEAAPRILDLTGEDLHKAIHAYGTNGIITEVEIPTTQAHDWVDVIVAFDDVMDSVHFAGTVGHADGLLVKEVAPVAAPVPFDYFPRHKKFYRRDQSICILMAAPVAVDPLAILAGRHKGEVVYRSDTATDDEKKGLPPAYELGWNHTTLRALRVDPTITYLQTQYPDAAGVEAMMKLFGDEVPMHCEVLRFNGRPAFAGLPLVRFTTEQRLDEIIRIHEDNGVKVFNPHRYTLEEGGMKQTDRIQLDFKREADPKGLLNPGKMIAWDDPNFDFEASRSYIFPGIREVA